MESIARYYSAEKSVDIYTDSNKDVKSHTLVIRDCTNLVQIDFVIKVLSNTPPYLEALPSNNLTINTGDYFNYTLPNTIDDESNDSLIRFIIPTATTTGKEETIPDFITYDETLNLLEFQPVCHPKEVGVWNFTFVVQEANSEIKNSSYDLKINVAENYTACIEVDFAIDALLQLSEHEPLIGQLWFTSPIDMDWIAHDDNFETAFRAVWYHIDDMECIEDCNFGQYADPEEQLKVFAVKDENVVANQFSEFYITKFSNDS